MDALVQTPALGTIDGYLSRLQAALTRLRHEELEVIVESLILLTLQMSIWLTHFAPVDGVSRRVVF